MLPIKIIVKVSKDNIESAIPGTSYNSPIAKAIKQQFPYLREVESFIDYISLGTYGKNMPWNYIYLYHTKESKKFEAMFNKKEAVRGTTFEFDVYRITPSDMRFLV